MKRSRIIGTRQLRVIAAATCAAGLAATAPAAHAAAVPAASQTPARPVAFVSYGTLVIVGTHRADDIAVGLSADGKSLLVDAEGGARPQSFDSATVTTIAAYLGHGDDRFGIDATNGAVKVPMLVSGGNGSDSITGGSGDDVLIGGRGDDTLLGGDGNDTIFGGSGDDSIDGQVGADKEYLGRGDDVALWLPGEGSDAIDGGSGSDTLRFDGADVNENFVVTAEGRHAVLTRDVGRIRMDTTGVDVLDLATRRGVDTVALGDLSGTDLRAADLGLGAVRGGPSDGQLDTVTVDGSASADRVDVNADDSTVAIDGLHTAVRVSGSDSRDQLEVNAGDGNDRVSVSDAARALITVGIDLGAGQF